LAVDFLRGFLGSLMTLIEMVFLVGFLGVGLGSGFDADLGSGFEIDAD
jgi:hypothetical protein